jgi:hypothetical protein
VGANTERTFRKGGSISEGGHMRIRRSFLSREDEKTFKNWQLEVLTFYLCISGLIAVSIVISSLITSVHQYAAR